MMSALTEVRIALRSSMCPSRFSRYSLYHTGAPRYYTSIEIFWVQHHREYQYWQWALQVVQDRIVFHWHIAGGHRLPKRLWGIAPMRPTFRVLFPDLSNDVRFARCVRPLNIWDISQYQLPVSSDCGYERSCKVLFGNSMHMLSRFSPQWWQWHHRVW